MRNGMTEYDFAAATVGENDPGLDPDELDRSLGWGGKDDEPHAAPPVEAHADDERRAADMMRTAIRSTLEITKANPFLMAAVFGRLGGMTLGEIGELSACTKQAVDKHLREIGKKHPEVENELRKRWHYQAAMHPMGAMLARLGVIDRPVGRLHRSRRHVPARMPDVFPAMAVYFERAG